jgi:PAS domain S-box-containing protein
VLLEDAHSDPDFLAAISGIVSEVCVPLMHEGKVAGILNVESIQGVKLTQADLNLMVRLSKDIEVAIGRAELYDDIQRELAERKRAEEALREARTFLQEVVDTSPSMIFVVDAAGKVVFVNQYTAQYYGSTPAAMVSKSTDAVHEPEAEAQEFVSDDQEVVRTRTKIVKEELNTAPDGQQHWFYTVKVPLVRPDGKVDVLGISTDITDRKKAQDELERYKERLEELVEQRTVELEAANDHLVYLGRTRDEFVSNVSHELRTPITNIKLYLELLGLSPDKHDQYLTTLRRESLRLESLIESLLMLSRMDQNRVPLALAPVDLNALAEEYVADRILLATNKRLNLGFQAGRGLSPVNADRNLLGEAIGILITNALNYTPAGGIIDVSTRKKRFERRLWYGITVADTGPGIDADDQARLFTRFFRGKAGLRSGTAGTGLGLAIASEIVGRHHGRLEAVNRTRPHRGAVFHIWLPPGPASQR